jgi:hypothetical protein
MSPGSKEARKERLAIISFFVINTKENIKAKIPELNRG